MWPSKPLDYIQLDNDKNGIHYGLFVATKLVAVISLFIEENSAQFRKLATLKEEQQKGYGSKLLSFILHKTEMMPLDAIWCNARLDKLGFYKKFGLEKTKASFKKGGKDFIILEKRFKRT